MGNMGQGNHGDLSLGMLEDDPAIMDIIGRGEACFPQTQQTRDRAVKQNYSWDMDICVHQQELPDFRTCQGRAPRAISNP